MNTRPKLNTTSALLVVVLYLVASIVVSLFASIFFGGIRASATDRVIDGVIDSSIVANLIVMVGLLAVSLWFFRASRQDIFFERNRFGLSKLYYVFPLVYLGVTVFALTQVDYAAYSVRAIVLILVATLAIGVNEEIVTRGILLVGLRNSGVAEWLVLLITVVLFSILHLVNVAGGAYLTVLLVTAAGGILLYVSRRVFGNLLVPIGLHVLYDVAFYLLPGKYLVGESLPSHVLDVQLGSFLVLFAASILFLVFGRKLLQQESTGWPANG